LAAPRVSIAGLMGLMVVAAIGLIGLRTGNAAWAGAISLVCLALLAGAVLKVIFRRGRERATWAGFALFGWTFLALNYEAWTGSGASRTPFSFTWLLDEIHPRIHALPPELIPDLKPTAVEPLPRYAMPPAAPPSSAPDLPVVPLEDPEPTVLGPAAKALQAPILAPITPTQPLPAAVLGSPFWAGNLYYYYQVGHALGALLFASLGAFWGRWACSPKEAAAAVAPSSSSAQDPTPA